MKLNLITMFFLILSFAAMVSAQEKPLQTVAKVDLNRYTGLWYEIAKIPNRFQKDCTGRTTAEYSLRPDGRISVKNSCDEEGGGRNIAEGIAKIEDNTTNAKLKVSFFSLLGIRPFWGDYWIIGLGENYDYAVVGDPSRKYGWILCRKPEITEKQKKEAFGILKAQGYDPVKFEFTRQR